MYGTMAPKKKSNSPKPDAKGNFMVRLPIHLQQPLKNLAKLHRRNTTNEIVFILEEHLRSKGILDPNPESNE